MNDRPHAYGEIWGYCYRCRSEVALEEGPGFQLGNHATSAGVWCPGSGRKPGYICSPPDEPKEPRP